MKFSCSSSCPCVCHLLCFNRPFLCSCQVEKWGVYFCCFMFLLSFVVYTILEETAQFLYCFYNVKKAFIFTFQVSEGCPLKKNQRRWKRSVFQNVNAGANFMLLPISHIDFKNSVQFQCCALINLTLTDSWNWFNVVIHHIQGRLQACLFALDIAVFWYELM